MNYQTQEQVSRLKKMGFTFIFLAIFLAGLSYFLPNSELNYWLSHDGKKGFYVFSAFFFFLGLYCLGAIWRKRY